MEKPGRGCFLMSYSGKLPKGFTPFYSISGHSYPPQESSRAPFPQAHAALPSCPPQAGSLRGSPSSDSDQGREINLSSVRNAACLSKASLCSLRAHSYGLLWTPASSLRDLPGGRRPHFLLEDRGSCSRERRTREPEADGASLVTKVPESPSQPMLGGGSSHNPPSGKADGN